MGDIRIGKPTKPIRANLHICGSKSISNRVLLIRALTDGDFDIENLSDSDDTQTMLKLLSSDAGTYDTHHAGTTYRFLTAFLSMKKGRQVLTGSDRMLQRPIAPLVDGLRIIGANITYLGEEGYPPLAIVSMDRQLKDEISLNAGISSQFISALCMIAPTLESGLTINLVGELVSRPYLEMTLSIMEEFGVTSSFEGNRISISPQSYTPMDYIVESDWSSASYHFAIAAIADDCEIHLSHYKSLSYQGDSYIVELAKAFGVETKFVNNGVVIKSSDNKLTQFSHDFLEQPDIAQTIAVMAASCGMEMTYQGLQTLSIKETDRVTALVNELAKVNVKFITETDQWTQSGTADVDLPTFDTYQDHRMAMAFAPLALLGDVVIRDSEVVTKSYPRFWQDLVTLGFDITYL